MKVHELMTHPARTCQPQDSLEKAARLLWEHDCGVIPIVDPEGRVRATITDRDICMGAYTRGKRLADLRVADSMSATVVSCRVDEDLAVAARRMAEHSVRRLPVVDGEGRIRGVVSLNDLARAAHKDEAVAREAMTVLTAVCRPRATLAKTATSATHSSGVVSRHGKQALPNPQRARVLMSSKVEPEC